MDVDKIICFLIVIIIDSIPQGQHDSICVLYAIVTGVRFQSSLLKNICMLFVNLTVFRSWKLF